MRVTSSFWVSAYVRRCYGEGAPAVILRRGAEEAGAIFIVVDRLDGRNDLYAPAPQAEFSEAAPSDRRFQRVREGVDGDSLRSALEGEARFDPDVWVIAVEDRDGRSRLDLVEDARPRDPFA